jgi:DNA modification methylase
VWERIGLAFLHLYNDGYSPKAIMKQFGTIFTWKVIEREIMRVSDNKHITIRPHAKKEFSGWGPGKFQLETKTVWFFPVRGKWAVHTGEYRGNWAPQVPRNLILRYSRKGERVLDPFVGGGTTLIEAWLLGRKGIGFDISPFAIAMTKKRLREMEHFASKTGHPLPKPQPTVASGDACNLLSLKNESIHLICTQPPYRNALRYTASNPHDLSRLSSTTTFCDRLEAAAEECYRVLRRGRRCALLMGDVRKDHIFTPLGFLAMNTFMKVGFLLEDVIIKKQQADRSSEFYKPDKRKFYHELNHEYLFVFRKPKSSTTERTAAIPSQIPLGK